MKYLNLFKKKETLNKILQKYNYGVVYSFILPVVASPLDIEDQKYSHLRLVDMKNNKRYILHKKNIKHIKVIDSKVIILKKDDTKIVLDNIAKQDQDKIAKLILAMIKNIALIEKEYFTMK
jgi:homospermidine synthase